MQYSNVTEVSFHRSASVFVSIASNRGEIRRAEPASEWTQSTSRALQIGHGSRAGVVPTAPVHFFLHFALRNTRSPLKQTRGI
jgi:hypothetical protein